MHKTIISLFLLSFSILTVSVDTGATTLVSEDFNDRAYSSPITIKSANASTIAEGDYDPSHKEYSATNAHGGSGYALQFDHSYGLGNFVWLSNFDSVVGSGVYIRYYMKFDANYTFSDEMGISAWNQKLVKFSSSAPAVQNIEVAFKSRTNFLSQYYLSNGAMESKWDGSYGTTITKNVWYKIEVYIRYGSGTLDLRVQVNDHDAINFANKAVANAALTATKEIIGPRVSSGGIPPSGHGFYYIDDLTVIAGEGDLCNNEPPQPSGSASPPPIVTAPAPIPENPPTGFSQTWLATTQTGRTSWNDSTSTWCVRVLLQGNAIASSGNQVRIGFMGRTSGDYSLKKVSIAEKDPSGVQGDIVDSTWARVTFNGGSVATWGSSAVTVPQGNEKLSDPISFPLQSGKDYYVTFMLTAPATYLVADADYNELYFDGVDHTDDLDWSSNGASVRAERLHALSSIQVSSAPLLGSPSITTITIQ